MAFPGIIYRDFGDEKVTSTAKIGGLPLGIRMILPDGKEFVHGRAGGTALIAGYLYEQVAAVADTMYQKALVCATAAVGATTVTITTGGTSGVTTDQYADGYLTIASSTGTGIGYSYKVKSCASAASGSTSCNITLYETDALKVALAGGTTKVGLRENENNLALVTTADTAITGRIIGVACNSAAASSYAWFQQKGPAPVFVGGTVVTRGQVVVASTGVAGAVADVVASTAGITSAKAGANFVGNVLMESTANGFSLIDLQLA